MSIAKCTYIFYGTFKRCFSTLLVMGMLQCFVLEVVSSWSAKKDAYRLRMLENQSSEGRENGDV